jgi:hypothetical protein
MPIASWVACDLQIILEMVSTDLCSSGKHVPMRPEVGVKTAANGRRLIARLGTLPPPLPPPSGFATFRQELTSKPGYDAVLADHKALGPEETVQCSDSEEILSPDRIQRGVEVLRLLKYTPHYIRFIYRLFENGPGILLLPPMTETWAKGIWTAFGPALESQDPEKMKSLSALIWKNSASSLVFDGNTTPTEWINLSTGNNLRWEVVGIILGLAKLCFGTLRDFDPIFSSIEESGIEQTELGHLLVKSVESCVEFCRALNNPTDLLLWLWFESNVVMYTTVGEGSFPSYMRAGETINIAIALGLHQEIKHSPNVPFFLTELRKRAFICCYFTDLNLATFLGRPPRLSSRYCAMNSPMAISDKQLWCEDPEERKRFLSRIDENGWNLDEERHRVSWSKYMHSSAIQSTNLLTNVLGTWVIVCAFGRMSLRSPWVSPTRTLRNVPSKSFHTVLTYTHGWICQIDVCLMWMLIHVTHILWHQVSLHIWGPLWPCTGSSCNRM